MRLHEIQFTNFRAFDSFRMEFEERATVIVGRNATGKSTILDGIAIALGQWTRTFRGPQEGRTIGSTDARLLAVEHAGVATTEQVFPVRIQAVGSVQSAQIDWTTERASAQALTTNSGPLVPQLASEFSAEALALGTRADLGEAVILPIVAYYRTRRLWVGRTSAERAVLGTADDGLQARAWGYHDALEAGADHGGVEQWMAWREADRIQQIARAVDEGRDVREVKSPQMEAVAVAAAACLEGAKRFYYSANHRELRIDFEKGPSIPFKSLSDGQKNIIAVAADIAWRAAQLNPHLGANVALDTPGIVLIDELDLHLHPAWQMRVLDDLLRAFPKMQFIVTTHSPQVMSGAPKNAVRLLDTS